MTKLPPELINLFAKMKVRKIVHNASEISQLFSRLGNNDTDVWCTLAYMAGAVRSLGIHSNQTTRFPRELWDAFEDLGMEHGKDAHDRAKLDQTPASPHSAKPSKDQS